MHVSTIRKEKGITVEELAAATGYEPSSIRRIEKGTLLPDRNRDIKIANALGISLDQLWGRKKFKEFFDSGQPKLKETEKTAITIIAPIMKALSREGRLYVIDTMLMRLKYEGSQVEWEQYEYNKK